MAGWSPDIQVLKSDVSGLLQLVSYVKFKVKVLDHEDRFRAYEIF